MTVLEELQYLLSSVISAKRVTIEYNENPYSIVKDQRIVYIWSEIWTGAKQDFVAVARFTISDATFEEIKYDFVRLLRSQFFYPVDLKDGYLTYDFDFNAMRLEIASVMRDFAPAEPEFED